MKCEWLDLFVRPEYGATNFDALLLVVEKVEVLFGKLLFDCLLVFASSKGGRAIDAKAVGIDF